MPKLPSTSSNGRAAANGKPRSRLAAILKSNLSGTDNVVIGSDESPVPGTEVRAGSMADVMQRVEGIRYLVKGWFPFAMPSMLVAEPGAGKSAFALYGLARPIIVGGLNWFNALRGPSKPGNVLWCDTEGTMAITVQRIRDWSLPAERIKVPFEDDPLLSINLGCEAHLEQIEAVIVKYRIPLVVIDSLRGAHDGDENSSRVAQVLQKLGGIAERTRAAIVIVHHTRKLYVDEELTANSSRGSNAILAMVRSQIGIDKPDKKIEWSRLQMLKENLGLKPSPIGFRISSKGVEFGSAPEKPRKTTEKDRAEDWLRANMEPGRWYNAGELQDEAEQDGFSETALRRARQELGIVKPDHLRKTKNGWDWMLPVPGKSKASGKKPGKTATA